MPAIVPIPRVPVSVRPAAMSDLPFIDALQKQHAKNLGYFPTKQFEGYIEMGAVLMACDPGGRTWWAMSGWPASTRPCT